MLSDGGGCPVGVLLQDEMGTQGCGRGASGGQLRRLQGSCHSMGVCPALTVTGGSGEWWLGGQAVPKMLARN